MLSGALMLRGPPSASSSRSGRAAAPATACTFSTTVDEESERRRAVQEIEVGRGERDRQGRQGVAEKVCNVINPFPVIVI